MDTSEIESKLKSIAGQIPNIQQAISQLPKVSPTAETPSGSLSGTMKDTTAVATATTAPKTSIVNPSSSNPFIMSQVLSSLQAKVGANNKLMTQRNLLLKQLYDQPLTEEEKGQLDPTFKSAIDTNDRNRIDMNLRLINDEIRGRTGTLDQSIQYLSDSYLKSMEDAEVKKQNAIDTILKFAQVYGDNAPDVLRSLYSEEQINQLKGIGIDIDNLPIIPTLKEAAPSISDEILSPTEAATLGVTYGTTKLEAAQMGIIPTKGTQQDVSKTVISINDGIDSLIDLWKKVPWYYKGQVGGRAAASTGAKERNKEVAAFESAKSIIGMQLTRLFEQGRISDQDRLFYMSQMPNLNQGSLEVVESSASQVKSQLQNKVDSTLNIGKKSSGENNKPSSMVTPDNKVYDLQVDGTYKLRQ